MGRLFFVTGTDTGIGKTVVTTLLVRHLLGQGRDVFALKPFSSGGRADPRTLASVLPGRPPLDSINPWHYRAPLTPLAAARQMGVRAPLREVLKFVERARARHEILLVEGAGGLLSPLAEGVDSRELIRRLDATPIVVVANRLGALNSALLTDEALGGRRSKARFALVATRPASGAVSSSNAAILGERLGSDRVVGIPWIPGWRDAPLSSKCRSALASLLA